jgi:ankyrin repeat protein
MEAEAPPPSPLEALQAAAQPALQALLEAAAAEVCPSVASVLATPREAVRRALTANGCDFACHAPIAAWLRLRATAAPAASARDGECGVFALSGAAGVRVVTRSAFGVLRSRDYADAAALAEAWLEAAPSGALGALIADARAAPGGALALTSRAALAAQRAQGRLLCATCGRFYAGRRGLRDHAQVAHGAAYEDSVAAVHAAKMAMVAVSAPRNCLHDDPLCDAALHADLAARAAASLAQRDALPPGLVAARDGDVAALAALLDAGWDARACADRHGSTALLWAAGRGHLEACRLLVGRGGCDARAAQRRDGRTALHWAARNGHVAVCAWLVQSCGCDAGAATRDGTTAFHWAAWRGHTAVMTWLADEARCDWRARNSYGCNAGQWAAQAGDIATCEWLLQRGLDWRILNDNGHSALHKAAAKGQAGVCAWLLRQPAPGLGWTHMQADGDGNTPARMAAAEGHAQLAAALQAAADAAAPQAT